MMEDNVTKTFLVRESHSCEAVKLHRCGADTESRVPHVLDNPPMLSGMPACVPGSYDWGQDRCEDAKR